MKLVKKKNSSKVSLAGRAKIQPNDIDLLIMVCVAEGWDEKDCEFIDVPKDIEDDVISADTIGFCGGGLTYSHVGTAVDNGYDEKVQAVKLKCPEVYDLLVVSGIIIE